MLEELQVLIPLLNKVTNGAIWGVIMFFVYHVFIVSVWGALAYYLIRQVTHVIKSVGSSATRINSVYEISGWEDKFDLYFNKTSLIELLKSVGRPDGKETKVYTSDIKAAIEKLKGS